MVWPISTWAMFGHALMAEWALLLPVWARSLMLSAKAFALELTSAFTPAGRAWKEAEAGWT